MKNRIEILVSFIHCAHQISYTIYSMEGEILEPSREDNFVDYLFRRRHLSFLKNHPDELILLGDPLGINWIGLNYNNCNYILGPVLEQSITQEALNRTLAEISYEERVKVIKSIRKIPIVLRHTLFQYALMFYYAVTEEYTDASKIVFESDLLADTLTQDPEESEENLKNCWYCEQELYNAIKKGYKCNTKKMFGQYAKIALRKIYPENTIRNKKNLSIGNLALSVHAAIHGGLPASTAYALQAYYTTRIENSRDMSSLSALNIELFEEFSSRVHNLTERKKRFSNFVIEVQDYISLHIEENVSLKELAKKFHYTEYYFSRKFKEESGIGIGEYIKKKRMERAGFLLLSTDEPISQIAEKLHFSTVSYFISEFKKYYKTTPALYRINK